MSIASLPAPTRAGGFVLLVACIVFVGMRLGGFHETALVAPAALGWAAAFVAAYPLVPREDRTALYFAFGITAFLLFFLHETYGLQGKVRTFPLMVGWAGVVLSALEILGLTGTVLGRAVSRFFGTQRRTAAAQPGGIGREIACFAALSGGVALVWLLGFLVATPIFVFLWMRLWGGKPLRHAVYAALATLAFIWLLFEFALSYELYRGVATEWLINALQ